jgi:hemolysin III
MIMVGLAKEELMFDEVCPISGETWMEEKINHRTHLIGLLLSVLGLPYLIYYSVVNGDISTFAAFTIYGITLVLLYLASTYYHGCKKLHHKGILRIIDHACIYLLIAGSYTPFTLGPLRDSQGTTLLIAEWSIAAVGIGLKVFAVDRFKIASLIGYLVMGWLVVFSWPVLVEKLPLQAIILVIAGGLSYTFGTIFFVWERIPFNHGIWHLFVLCGSICHYFAILLLIP